MEDSKLGDTKFPSIDGHAKELLYHLEQLYPTDRPIVNMIGTVKLHGSHADISYDLDQSDLESSAGKTIPTTLDGISFQSRNRKLKPDESMMGFPIMLSPLASTLHKLKHLVIQRYKELNEQPLDITSPLIIAGEWIGQGVQKNVAVSQLTRRFVIVSIRINNEWQDDARYADIEIDPIFNVHRAQTFSVPFDTKDLTPKNPAFAKMQSLADQVRDSCPFAHTFGVEGPGEGIVWKVDVVKSNPEFWYKTVSVAFREKIRKDPNTEGIAAKQAVSPSKQQANDLANEWATRRRVEQAIEYLKEFGNDVTIKELPKAMTWVVADVMKEEKIAIEESKVNTHLLAASIRGLVAIAYKDMIKDGAVS